jgi:hypothetical protein
METVMNRRVSIKKVLRGVDGISWLLLRPVVKIGSALVLGDRQTLLSRRLAFEGDDVEFEIFENHFHLEDVTGGILQVTGKERETLARLGYAVMLVIYGKLKPFLHKNNVLFYIGGRDTVMLRFHTEVTDRNWIDIEDWSLLERENVRVFRATKSSLMALPPYSETLGLSGF